MKKKLALLSASALIVACLSACGGSKKDPKPLPTEPTVQPTSSPVAPTSEPVEPTSSPAAPTTEPTGEPSTSEPVVMHTARFHLNYEGAPEAEVVEVEDGDYLERPAQDPAREGYKFIDWFEDEDCFFEFDFNSPIHNDVDIYADWIKAYTVTYYLNAPEQEQSVYLVDEVAEGSLATRPADPKLAGYKFLGWFNTAECLEGEEFSFDDRIKADAEAFAKWGEPDWESVDEIINAYLGIAHTIYGISIPKYLNSDYTAKAYMDGVLVSSPETAVPSFVEALRADEVGAWNIDEEKGTAENEWVKLMFADNEKNGFQLLVQLNDAEGAFPVHAYQVGTAQNLFTLPDVDESLVASYEGYAVTLTTGAPAALVYVNFPEQVVEEGQEPLSDKDYFNQCVAAYFAALQKADSGIRFGKFSSGEQYMIDGSLLTMNQIGAFDAKNPLQLELLSYNYFGVYVSPCDYFGADGETISGLVAETFEAEISFEDVKLNPEFATNGLNFVIQYDYDEGYAGFCILGVAATQEAVNGVVNDVINTFLASDEWTFDYSYINSDYCFFHLDENDVADFQLTYDVIQRPFGVEIDFQIVKAESEFDGKDFHAWMDLQRLEGDESEIPTFEGDYYAFVESEGMYGDSYALEFFGSSKADIENFEADLVGFVLNEEESFIDAEEGYGYHLFVSESQQFQLEIEFDVYEDGEFNEWFNPFINVKAGGKQHYEFAEADLVAQRAALRTGVELDFSSLHATYTEINMWNSYVTLDEQGYVYIDLVSDIAIPVEEPEEPLVEGLRREGDSDPIVDSTEEPTEEPTTTPTPTEEPITQALEDDIKILVMELESAGFEYDEDDDCFRDEAGRIVYFEILDDAEEYNGFYYIEITIVGNAVIWLDDGHVAQYSPTYLVADNGDEFLMGYAHEALENNDGEYFNGYVEKPIEASALPSLSALIGEDLKFVQAELDLSRLTLYDDALSYFIYLHTTVIDEDEEAANVKALMSAYEQALYEAGFVDALNKILTEQGVSGYWNENSGEFVILGFDEGENENEYVISILVIYTGALMRSYIEPVEPEEPATPTPTVTATPTGTPAGE